MTSRLHGGAALQLVVNGYWEPLAFELPAPSADSSGWRLLVDTSRAAPSDVYRLDDAPLVETPSYTVPARTVVILGASPAAVR